MDNLSPRLQILLASVSHCIKQNDGKAFLHGDLLLRQLTGNKELTSNKVKLVVASEVSFEVHKFYQCLGKHIVVNREIESSDKKYHIMTSGFELILDLVPGFDPTRLVAAKEFGHFNIDMLFRDIDTQELRHPPEVSPDVSLLQNLIPPEEWNFEDVLGFVEKKGTFPDIEVDAEQYQRLRDLSLAMTRESLDVSWEEEIERVLLSRHPGSAMKFLSETFVDGMPWTFKVLIDYLIDMDVPVNEEATIETVFDDKKFEKVDLYNDYFLTEKKSFETVEELQHRLTTTVKLFFDSPTLIIPKPYIHRVQAMAGGTLGRCCLGSSGTYFGCGENIDEIDCHLPQFCSAGSDQCLQQHPSFAHISEQNWDTLIVTHREWCPDQVCPEDNAVHCLEDIIDPPVGSSSSSQSSSSSAASCGSCPQYDFHVGTVNTPPVQTYSSSIDPGGCKILRFYLFYHVDFQPFSYWEFSLCADSGGSSDFPGKLEWFLPDEGSDPETYTNDCPSSPTYSDTSSCAGETAPFLGEGLTSGFYNRNIFIKVSEDGGNTGGAFTLTYVATSPT